MDAHSPMSPARYVVRVALPASSATTTVSGYEHRLITARASVSIAPSARGAPRVNATA